MAAHVGGARVNVSSGQALEARHARGQIEAAVDAAGWPWSRRLSFWIDLLLLIEEDE